MALPFRDVAPCPDVSRQLAVGFLLAGLFLLGVLAGFALAIAGWLVFSGHSGLFALGLQ